MLVQERGGITMVQRLPLGRALLCMTLLVGSTGCAFVVRSSVTNTGAQADDASSSPSLSDTGRFLAFTSAAANLVSGDTNATTDVFVRDHQTNTTTRVSIGDDESQGNGPSRAPSITDDGRYVAFESRADNLVPGDPSGLVDVFVRDVVSGTTRRVSGAPVQGFVTSGEGPAISGDGRHVVYLAKIYYNELIFLQSVVTADLQLGASTTIATATINPPIGPAQYSALSISDDGEFVTLRSAQFHGLGFAFVSFALWQRSTGSLTTVASSDSTVIAGDGVVSGNGRYVAFSTQLDAVPEPDTCADGFGPLEVPPECDSDVFVWDRVTGAYAAITGSTGDGVAEEHHISSISDDGAVVLFTTQRPDAPGDPVRLQARDRLAGITQGVTAEAPPGDLELGTISGDGRLVAIGSGSPLVGHDTNLARDVYVRRTFVPSVATRGPNLVAAGGPPVPITLTGSGFEPGLGIGAFSGLTFTDVDVVDARTIRAMVTATADALPGPRHVFIVNPAIFPGAGIGMTTGRCAACLTVT
jgi:Tol biopolymer transport system component